MKVQALKANKIGLPPLQEMVADDWIVTVDGTHSLWNEPSHPKFSQDTTAHAHKKKHAGLCCELGIGVFESKVHWMNGPFCAGANDKSNFIREGGLKDVLTAIGKKAVAEKGHTGYPDQVSTFNAFDSDAVKKFKSRAQMRHEQFNGMPKECSSLADQFRHRFDNFGVCFDAACVICQHRMENGKASFDVLAGIEEEEEEPSWLMWGRQCASKKCRLRHGVSHS